MPSGEFCVVNFDIHEMSWIRILWSVCTVQCNAYAVTCTICVLRILNAKTSVRLSGPHFQIHRTELQSTDKKNTIQFKFLFAPFSHSHRNAYSVLMGRVCVRVSFLLSFGFQFILHTIYFYHKTILNSRECHFEWNVFKIHVAASCILILL